MAVAWRADFPALRDYHSSGRHHLVQRVECDAKYDGAFRPEGQQLYDMANPIRRPSPAPFCSEQGRKQDLHRVQRSPQSRSRRDYEKELGHYAGCNENFVLVTTGITAVLSFGFPVMSEDGNRLHSKLTTHDSKRQGLALRRILQSAGIPRAPALGYLALLPAPSPLQSTRLLFVAKMTSWRGPPPKFGFAGRAYSLFPTFFKLPRPVGPKFFRY